MFSLLPLFGALAGGRVFRWFAINIPMQLAGNRRFTSDLDVIARLYNFPGSCEWIYKTWEVKVSLLCKDGTARSLKSGKTERTLTQLGAYRDFGSPDVSLLDIYLCEAGFMRNNSFPPASLQASISGKLLRLKAEGFGYQMLPFENAKDGEIDVGLLAMTSEWNPLRTTFNILPATLSPIGEDFSGLVRQLDDFY